MTESDGANEGTRRYIGIGRLVGREWVVEHVLGFQLAIPFWETDPGWHTNGWGASNNRLDCLSVDFCIFANGTFEGDLERSRTGTRRVVDDPEYFSKSFVYAP